MSHDQRPGKMRVVQDSARPTGARRTDPPGMGVARGGETGAIDAAAGASLATGKAAAGAAGQSLPLLPAAIFLVACLVGGVAVALFRPF